MKKLFSLLLYLSSVNAFSQTDSLLRQLPEEDLIENFIQNQEEETAFDYNDLFDNFERLRRRPVNLNQASFADLESLPYLSDLQRQSLLDYRQLLGDFISVFELQAVPGFDLNTIQQILPYITIPDQTLLQTPISKLRENASQQLLLRWSRVLQTARGYLPPEDSTDTRYLGNRNQLYLRYRFSSGDKLSFGMTAEKDAGETFFKGDNRQGFDFYSAYIQLNNPIAKVKTLVLGDYAVSLGQGLILQQGFANGKSSFATMVKRTAKTLRPYASVNETDFFRGGATFVELGKNLDFIAFGSYRKRDGNLLEPDDPDDPDAAFVSSLQASGLHRTKAEIEDERALGQISAGGALRFQQGKWRVALNGLFEKTDKSLSPAPAVYNQFYFAGNQLFNIGIDYAYTLRNYHFFGETARSDNGAIATLNGALITLSRGLDVAVVHRHFPRNYQAQQAKAFGETRDARNEQGLYLGFSAKPTKRWLVNGYFDAWKHPFARFNADFPSVGSEWLLRITYSVRRKMDLFLQVREETKESNGASFELIDRLVPKKNFQGRFQVSYQLNRSLLWRSRFDAGFYDDSVEKQTGMALFQDLIFKQPGFPLSFGGRIALFDTDGSGLRFYAYENDLLNDFSVPSFSGRGIRTYVNARWQINRTFMLEARYGRTMYADLEVVGAGLELIEGNVKSEVKMQLRANF